MSNALTSTIPSAAPIKVQTREALLRFASAKCSAELKAVGSKSRYFPKLDDKFIRDPKCPDGFDTDFDAVKRAQAFKAECGGQLAELMGSV